MTTRHSTMVSLDLPPWVALLPVLAIAACGGQAPVTSGARPHARATEADTNTNTVPAFASEHYEPFNRADTVAIARREWILFGQPVDDDPPDTRPPPTDPLEKPERQPGLWERVGEYWWIGQDPDGVGHAWTGKHDEDGHVFPFQDDAHYAWSAAFISYVMRTAGANTGFPYAANHATYINAAVSGEASALKAWRTTDYAPRPGDLICFARGASRGISYDALPTASSFPAHCDLVVAADEGSLSVIGGNVDDAVTMKHVPIGADGRLAAADGTLLDTRYNWLVVLQVLYESDDENPGDR